MSFFKRMEQVQDPKQLQEIQSHLLPGEDLLSTYTLLVDYAAATSHRVIYVDKEVTSKETVLNSIPYSKINCVSLGKGGFMKFSKNVYIYGSGFAHKVSFLSSENAHEFYVNICSKIM